MLQGQPLQLLRYWRLLQQGQPLLRCWVLVGFWAPQGEPQLRCWRLLSCWKVQGQPLHCWGLVGFWALQLSCWTVQGQPLLRASSTVV